LGPLLGAGRLNLDWEGRFTNSDRLAAVDAGGNVWLEPWLVMDVKKALFTAEGKRDLERGDARLVQLQKELLPIILQHEGWRLRYRAHPLLRNASLQTAWIYVKKVFLPVPKVSFRAAAQKPVEAEVVSAPAPDPTPQKPAAGAETLSINLTLDSGALKRWGVERILVDGIQNHLPDDSGGLTVKAYLRLKNGRTAPWEKAKDIDAAHVEAIVFEDDGWGYDRQQLRLFLSTKNKQDGTVQKKAAGQFGEGQKMVTAAAVRDGLAIEFRSWDARQSWRAAGGSRPITVNAGKPNERNTHEVLMHVEDAPRPKTPSGSQTTISRSQEAQAEKNFAALYALFQGLGELALHVRSDYRPLASSDAGSIVAADRSLLYVRGLKVVDALDEKYTSGYGSWKKTLFSYDFADADINRDRDTIPNNELTKLVWLILESVPDAGILKTLLEVASQENGAHYDISSYSSTGSQYLEFQSIDGYYAPKNAGAWKTAFHELFGEEALVAASASVAEAGRGPAVGDSSTKQALQDGRKVVYLNMGLAKMLKECGVKTTIDEYPPDKKSEVPTSLTLDYGADKWGVERIVLDGVQNHLPADSGADNAYVEFTVDGEKWIGLSRIREFKDEEIKAVRFRDDSDSGYDISALEFFHSTKMRRVKELKARVALLEAGGESQAALNARRDEVETVQKDFARADQEAARAAERVDWVRTRLEENRTKLAETKAKIAEGEKYLDSRLKMYQEFVDSGERELEQEAAKSLEAAGKRREVLARMEAVRDGIAELTKRLEADAAEAKRQLPALREALKQAEEAAGAFGEGLKMISAAALRLDLGAELQSRDWKATPFAKDEAVNKGRPDESSVKRLSFKMVHRGDGRYRSGSITQFNKPSPELLREVRAIPENILYFNPAYKPVARTRRGEVKDLRKAEVFVKGILIPGEASKFIALGYNFLDIPTSRDRDMLKIEDLSNIIGDILAETDSVEVLAAVIKAAVQRSGSALEFQDVTERPGFANAETWKKAFESLYDPEKTVLMTDPGLAAEARYMGFKVVSMNGAIAGMLHKLGIAMTDRDVVGNAEPDFIEESDLNETERAVFDLRHLIDPFIPGNSDTTIRLYDKVINKKTGKVMPILGYWDPKDNSIGISRAVLQDMLEFIDTYIHEKAHQISHATDGTREHFNQANLASAMNLIRLLRILHPGKLDGLLGTIDAKRLAELTKPGSEDRPFSRRHALAAFGASRAVAGLMATAAVLQAAVLFFTGAADAGWLHALGLGATLLFTWAGHRALRRFRRDWRLAEDMAGFIRAGALPAASAVGERLAEMAEVIARRNPGFTADRVQPDWDGTKTGADRQAVTGADGRVWVNPWLVVDPWALKAGPAWESLVASGRLREQDAARLDRLQKELAPLIARHEGLRVSLSASRWLRGALQTAGIYLYKGLVAPLRPAASRASGHVQGIGGRALRFAWISAAMTVAVVLGSVFTSRAQNISVNIPLGGQPQEKRWFLKRVVVPTSVSLVKGVASSSFIWTDRNTDRILLAGAMETLATGLETGTLAAVDGRPFMPAFWKGTLAGGVMFAGDMGTAYVIKEDLGPLGMLPKLTYDVGASMQRNAVNGVPLFSRLETDFGPFWIGIYPNAPGERVQLKLEAGTTLALIAHGLFDRSPIDWKSTFETGVVTSWVAPGSRMLGQGNIGMNFGGFQVMDSTFRRRAHPFHGPLKLHETMHHRDHVRLAQLGAPRASAPR
jgi:hypothetical protein